MNGKRVCFVSPNSYPVLSVACDAPHGGAEQQMVLLAKAFSERGYQSHVVTLDHGQPDGELIDGLRVWPAYARSAGIPVIRFFHPRATRLLRALARADADIYVQSPAGMGTGLTAWFCRRRGIPFVYRGACDADFMPGQQFIRLARDRRLYEYGLRRADVIIVQTRKQRELLGRNYGLDGYIGGSLVEPSASPLSAEERGIDVLWVGTIRELKRPEMVLKLARRLPGRRFRVVGGPDAEAKGFYRRLEQESGCIGNLEWMGLQPAPTTSGMYSHAKVLVSTSEIEGFPNTYLQAWMAGTPVVAFFDPDDLIARKGLGVVVRSLDEAARAIEKLVSDPAWWRECSDRVRAYALENHGPAVADRYERLVSTLLREPN